MAVSLTQLLPKVRENVALAPYTTYKIGGPARWFFVARKEDDIVRAARAAQEAGAPFFILGGGSNLLVSDQGFDGLVIQIRNSKFEIRNSILEADAGVDMGILVSETTKRGLQGLEWAGGLPGTLGGAVRGNAGAFGGEIKDCICSVRALLPTGEIRVFSREECNFSYRNSLFKEKGFVVLSAKFLLRPGDARTLTEEVERHIAYRRERHPLEYPNAGSMFKNCDLNLFSKKLQRVFGNAIKHDPFPVIPTAFLLAEAGVKGMRYGGAEVSTKHPNFFVNARNATARDIFTLSEQAKQKIYEKFGVRLEREIQLVGTFD